MTPSACLLSLYELISAVCLFTVNEVGCFFLYLWNFGAQSANIK